MKNLFKFIALAMSICLASCDPATKANKSTPDSLKTDSAKLDSIKKDSAKKLAADTGKKDTVKKK